MPLIALTGGIASGKSTIANRLQELGAEIVDADALVRELQAPGEPLLQEIAAEFGADLIDGSGALDRAALGSIVFSDESARHRLNALVHPAVIARSRQRFDEAFARNPGAVVVYDVPLLVEARPDDRWDLVVLAEAPESVRIERMVQLRGLGEQEARDRISAQASDQARRQVADVIIATGGSMAETIAAVDKLWQQLVQPKS